mgnify:CR=1 FL=1
MGYRSDVLVCLDKDAAEKLRKLCEEAKEDKDRLYMVENPGYGGLDDVAKNGEAYFFWEDVKWYPSYSEVAFINEFLDGLESQQYLFWELGEDGDFEKKGEYTPEHIYPRLIKRIDIGY